MVPGLERRRSKRGPRADDAELGRVLLATDGHRRVREVGELLGLELEQGLRGGGRGLEGREPVLEGAPGVDERGPGMRVEVSLLRRSFVRSFFFLKEREEKRKLGKRE